MWHLYSRYDMLQAARFSALTLGFFDVACTPTRRARRPSTVSVP